MLVLYPTLDFRRFLESGLRSYPSIEFGGGARAPGQIGIWSDCANSNRLKIASNSSDKSFEFDEYVTNVRTHLKLLTLLVDHPLPVF